MTWTKDKPTVPGFYWHRAPDRAPSVVEVIQNVGELVVSFTRGEHDWLQFRELHPDSEWCGPLELPS